MDKINTKEDQTRPTKINTKGKRRELWVRPQMQRGESVKVVVAVVVVETVSQRNTHSSERRERESGSPGYL